ncbi:MAG TPA: serine/threonine-protein kinase, partial [Ktedonobacterales bacterium]|nr:serine/threonine-protein kinase [Ktedonobacterales bacterium]
MGAGDGAPLGRLGGYRLRALLGTGGMAEVYRALDPRLGREVAVKVLPASLAADPNYVARFRDEARRVAVLNHPHIVPVYHYGEEGGLLFLVMPILRESLRDRLGREGILPPAEAGRIAVEIASALEAAHDRSLVHRDVKPENILLDNKGRALLTDFGIAREMSFLRRQGAIQTLAATGLPVGTPEYMAPEQLRGGAADQRADIYGLGAVLYEMVTGVVPHEADTPYEVAALVLTAPLARPSFHNQNISPALENIIMKALAKNADDRYPDARSFAEAVVAAIAEPKTLSVPAVGAWPRKTRRFDIGQPRHAADVPDARRTTLSSASPPPNPRRSLRGISRQRVTVLAVASVLLLSTLCGGSALALVNGFQPSWLAPNAAVAFATPTATSTPLPTETAHLPTAIVTPKPSSTPQASPTRQPTATSTPTPVPTATPVPALTLPDIPIVMSLNFSTCYGHMTIRNDSPVTLGWSWQTINESPSVWNNYSYSFTNGGTYTSFS